MTIEKRKKQLSAFEQVGENLGGPDVPLEKWERSFRQYIGRRREDLRRRLVARGVNVSEEKNKEEK